MSSSKTPKRALPSWMSARDDQSGNNDEVDDTNRVESSHKKVRGQGKGVEENDEEHECRKKVGPSKLDFSKLLEGVVFALSGFVNPERGILRSQALEMGAEYQQDWNPSCTLLVCAYRNTPKFRQVEADGGTIVSKDWIIECYTQKKLVDIETYLMNVGKPWRKSKTHTGNQVCETSEPRKSSKPETKKPEVKSDASSSRKKLEGNALKFLKDKFSAQKVKEWAVDDLNRTLSWLESQEEKPEPSEIRNVAAEGILTCLQDAIDLLHNDKDLKHLAEDWNIVPRVVEQLIEVQGRERSYSISKDNLQKQAIVCKNIYERELTVLDENNRESKPKSSKLEKGKNKSMEYDSDETIEMTEDEINEAYTSIASTIPVS